ncbi:histidine phosphatase family protein [Marinicrinis lubricantis]|uniref:Histidine phosphatase family protein n=1 Tax=Marinicrinis lubricantis TaxID=2086470 RepID=A0ABW1IP70_9BACL
MVLTFYLVRHALKEKAVGDVPITTQGVLQAQWTTEYFKRIPISSIVASPLRRAQETAQYIANETKSEIAADDRLRERANWGDLPGQTFEEFVQMWDRCTADPDYIPPVGDSARQAAERLSSLLTELSNTHTSGDHIVVVTHGGLITDFLVNHFPEHELNVWHPRFIAEQSSLIPECSITKLVCDQGKYRIEDFASTKHLNE